MNLDRTPRHRWTQLAATVLASHASSIAWANDTSAVQAQVQVAAGKHIYEKWCIECHGAGPGFMGRPLTGTEALEAKYEGKLPPVLTDRTDLTPAFVGYFVRHGISLMPFFRRTEISDDDLAAVGAYLSRHNPDHQP